MKLEDADKKIICQCEAGSLNDIQGCAKCSRNPKYKTARVAEKEVKK